MPDEVAVPVAAPVEAPAAVEEAPAAPKESFEQAFERHKAKLEASGAIQPERDEPEPTPQPEKSKANGKKVVAANPELEQLTTLAKKLGFTLESDKILPSDRAKFRNWEKERTGRLEQTERERLSKLEAREKEADSVIKWAQTLKQTKENGDYQGLAKELGFENWDKLQEDVIQRISDPNYKRLRELEERAARKEEEEAKAKAEAEQREHQQKAITARQRVYDKFAQEMPQSKDPLVSAMGDHPLFVNAVLAIQEENWKGKGSELPYERMAGMGLSGRRTVREECKELYERLDKAAKAGAFGPVTAPAAPKRPVGKSAPVPPSRAVEASGAKAMTRHERDEYERRRLAEAIEQDRKRA